MLLEDSPQLQQVLPANWWQENNVHLHSGVTIKTLGRDTRELVLTNGESWHWDQLFIDRRGSSDCCRCLMHWENAALPYAMPVMPPDCEKFCSPNGQS